MMGDKIESKRIASKAKVNMIPGYDGEVPDEDAAVKISNEIGEQILLLWYTETESVDWIFYLYVWLVNGFMVFS